METQLQLPWMGQQLEIALKHQPELTAKEFICKNCQNVSKHRWSASWYNCMLQPVSAGKYRHVKAKQMGCSKFKRREE